MRPNCDLVERLEDESKFRCNNLNFTEPLYEQVLGYFSTVEAGTFTDHAAMEGKSSVGPRAIPWPH
ncbi:hypothetical protein [Actibacterium sp. 188UL27-1]|uniref:hypothetical protein n=1 Tax=Actibacterium sp. 188UL27-1 TaxID=2786961 RepID=UPI00195D48E4|nr:hypothetical protein [Actibacterium sp. 188UL27-1]MBM7067056.1 hypothetical protein [Actibacterium sp. 188UL27-1]